MKKGLSRLVRSSTAPMGGQRVSPGVYRMPQQAGGQAPSYMAKKAMPRPTFNPQGVGQSFIDNGYAPQYQPQKPMPYMGGQDSYYMGVGFPGSAGGVGANLAQAYQAYNPKQLPNGGALARPTFPAPQFGSRAEEEAAQLAQQGMTNYWQKQ